MRRLSLTRNVTPDLPCQAVTLHLRSFYCNWIIIGNVLANVDLSIDDIDSHNSTFNGFYKVTFYGTRVAAGSGYYKAVIVPADTARLAQRTP